MPKIVNKVRYIPDTISGIESCSCASEHVKPMSLDDNATWVCFNCGLYGGHLQHYQEQIPTKLDVVKETIEQTLAGILAFSLLTIVASVFVTACYLCGLSMNYFVDVDTIKSATIIGLITVGPFAYLIYWLGKYV